MGSGIKKFDFSKSILSETGKKEVRKVLVASYKKLEKYILTRNNIVHDTYDMRYVNEEQKIEIRCFSFNLSKGNDLKKETYHKFVISRSEIKNLLVSIYSLRKNRRKHEHSITQQAGLIYLEHSR